MVASIDDYSASIVIPQMVKAQKLRGGAPVIKNGRPVKYSGGCCVVFPYEVYGQKYAVRCWHYAIGDIQQRSMMIADTIGSCGLPYFASFEYVRDGIMTACGPQPCVIMDWIDAKPLKRYLSENLYNSTKIDALSDAFLKMSCDLKDAGISHGDIHHGNILVRDDGSLVLVDYDSMFVPGMEGFSDVINGIPGYQHPSRKNQRKLSPYSDYFPELVIYTSLQALSRHPGLWKKLNMEDSDTMILSKEDILSGGKSEIFSILEADHFLRPLGRALQYQLKQNSLKDLMPLGSVLNGPVNSLLESISAKWADNGYVVSRRYDDIPEVVRALARSW